MLRNILLFLAIILVIFVIVTIRKSNANDLRAEQTHPPVGQFITVENTAVHYTLQGNGPVVILLHGAGGNLRDFTFELVAKLTPTYTVLAFDRPGHGYTKALHNRGESPAEQAKLLQAVTQKLGISKAILAGYSYGGAVALAWALDYPETVEGLVLMSAVSNPWVKPPSFLYALAAGPITGPIFTTLISAYAPKSMIDDSLASLFTPQKPPKNYLSHIGAGLSMRKSTLRTNGLQVHNLLPYIQQQSKRYQQLTLPIEIIHGAKDTTVPAAVHADVLARQLPHANYVLLEDLGHDTQHYAHKEIINGLARLAANR